MIDGILLINKEVSITSYDVLRRLKRIFSKGQKIGHAGTLDPFATGLLIVLLGKYTKLMPKFLEMEKEYIVKAEFGYATDTQDITGEKILLSNQEIQIKEEEIVNIIKQNFLGNILQQPPLFSAKKVKGKKAYEYARERKSIELESKNISVEDYSIVKYEWPYVTFRIVCSSGTYVRTLINDLGFSVGTYATAVELVRVRIGNLHIEDSISSAELFGKKIEEFKILNTIQ